MRWFIMLICCFGQAIVSAQVTYYGSIAPIIKKHCQHCHQDGDIGPMPLTSYEEVVSYASMIKFVTETKLMPPFKASHDNLKFENERSISDHEKALIASWIEGGLEQGKESKEVESSKPTDNTKYDYKVCMSEPFEHYGIYYDQYQVFALPIELPEGKFINDVIFEPGNRKIVRSANISIAPKGSSLGQDIWDPRYGFFTYGNLKFTTSFPNWYSWMPHTNGLKLEAEESLFIPKDSELLLHIHYGPYGQIQKDSSCIHMSFSDEAQPIIQNVPLVHPDFLLDTFLIESGLRKRISSSFVLPTDVSLRSVTPLAHLLCRTWEVIAVFPDKSSSVLLSIDDWDFHWKEKYVFEQKLLLPAGTKIFTTATYDNTKKNPYNPSELPHTMKAGPHMYDENFICYFEFDAINSDKGYIEKPFITTDHQIGKVVFSIKQQGNYELKFYNLSIGSVTDLSSKFYARGSHTLVSSQLPRKSGRYAFTLSVNGELVDSWFVVIL